MFVGCSSLIESNPRHVRECVRLTSAIRWGRQDFAPLTGRRLQRFAGESAVWEFL